MGMLKEKSALITGGTAGIGREIALTFAKEGADVIILGTSPERAEAVCAEMQKVRLSETQHVASYIVDMHNSVELASTLQAILEKQGKIDILVNNAGITRDQLLMKMTEEEWDSVIAVNLKSVYLTCHALIRPMMKAKKGKIINISSVIGLTGNAGQTNYAASKAGIIGFTKALAQEVATRNICVNCIAPGFIKTRMTDSLTDEQKEGILDKIPMRRMGTPEDVAAAALFLASEQASYITGQVLTVDGGMVM